MQDVPEIKALELFIQVIFQFDVVVKIFAEGRDPINYWTGPQRGWNNFDCWLVAICWVPQEALGGNVSFLRLLRLMRLFKLVSKVKQLQTIVFGLLKGLSSVTYIILLLLLVFYLYAVLGVVTFRKNDPWHFGELGQAMITLFRLCTFDGWTGVLYINVYGCNSQNLFVEGVSGSKWLHMSIRVHIYN